MNKIELARIIAKRSPTRIIEIQPETRSRATHGSPQGTFLHRRDHGHLSAEEVLVEEQKRLARAWSK
jgi:hypothetical protein